MNKIQLRKLSIFNLKNILKTDETLTKGRIRYINNLIKQKKLRNIEFRDKFLESKLFKLTMVECLRKGKCDITKVFGVDVVYAYPFDEEKFWKTVLNILYNAEKKDLMERLRNDTKYLPCIQV